MCFEAITGEVGLIWESQEKITGALLVDQRNKLNRIDENAYYQRQIQAEIGRRSGGFE
jgi:hypothetical protein